MIDDDWRKHHNARFGIGTGRIVPIEEPIDDPHDGMPYTEAQERRATAEAVERRMVARDPEKALRDPDRAADAGLWGWLALFAIITVALVWLTAS